MTWGVELDIRQVAAASAGAFSVKGKNQKSSEGQRLGPAAGSQPTLQRQHRAWEFTTAFVTNSIGADSACVPLPRKFALVQKLFQSKQLSSIRARTGEAKNDESRLDFKNDAAMYLRFMMSGMSDGKDTDVTEAVLSGGKYNERKAYLLTVGRYANLCAYSEAVEQKKASTMAVPYTRVYWEIARVKSALMRIREVQTAVRCSGYGPNGMDRAMPPLKPIPYFQFSYGRRDPDTGVTTQVASNSWTRPWIPRKGSEPEPTPAEAEKRDDKWRTQIARTLWLMRVALETFVSFSPFISKQMLDASKFRWINVFLAFSYETRSIYSDAPALQSRAMTYPDQKDPKDGTEVPPELEVRQSKKSEALSAAFTRDQVQVCTRNRIADYLVYYFLFSPQAFLLTGPSVFKFTDALLVQPWLRRYALAMQYTQGLDAGATTDAKTKEEDGALFAVAPVLHLQHAQAPAITIPKTASKDEVSRMAFASFAGSVRLSSLAVRNAVQRTLVTSCHALALARTVYDQVTLMRYKTAVNDAVRACLKRPLITNDWIDRPSLEAKIKGACDEARACALQLQARLPTSELDAKQVLSMRLLVDPMRALMDKTTSSVHVYRPTLKNKLLVHLRTTFYLSSRMSCHDLDAISCASARWCFQRFGDLLDELETPSTAQQKFIADTEAIRIELGYGPDLSAGYFKSAIWTGNIQAAFDKLSAMCGLPISPSTETGTSDLALQQLLRAVYAASGFYNPIVQVKHLPLLRALGKWYASNVGALEEERVRLGLAKLNSTLFTSYTSGLRVPQ